MLRRLRLDSFAQRLIGFTVTIIALSIIVSFFLTSVLYTRNITAKNEQQTLESFSTVDSRISALLSDVYNTANELCRTDAVLDYMLLYPESEADRTLIRFRFANELADAVKSTSDVSTVAFFNDAGQMAGISTRRRFFPADTGYPFHAVLESLSFHNPTEIIWLDSIPMSSLVQSDASSRFLTDRDMVCGLSQFVYSDSRSLKMTVITFLFEVNPDSLLRCFSQLAEDGSRVYLLNSSGQIISGSDSVGSVPDFYERLLQTPGSSFIFTDSARDTYQIISRPTSNAGWTLVRCIPRAVYMSSIYTLWKSAGLICLVMLVLAGLLYTIWARNYCKPVLTLAKVIEDVRQGNLDTATPMSDRYPAEIRLVCEQFNEMLADIKRLLLQKEASEQERLSLEIKTLQAQITPHFVYNTLSAIRWMAAASGAENVESALITFSDIIHPVFNSWQQDWTLQEEIDFLGNYIKLMRMRFGNKMQITSVPDPDTVTCRVPRFALQTLLENCCEHALDIDRILHIELRSQIIDGMLYIRISDDGLGMSEERLQEIRASILSNTPTRSIGLINLNRRIKLFYGEDCGLEIQSRIGEGTTIIMRAHIL